MRGTTKELNSHFESLVTSQSLTSLLNSFEGSVAKDDFAQGGGEAPATADGNLDFFVS